jgi:DNA 3'-phosphatase
MKRILFIDLDGTLIEPASGKTFPEFIGDMKFKDGILCALKNFFLENKQEGCLFGFLFIVTNQGGIEHGLVNRDAFEVKLKFVCACIIDYISIEYELKSVIVDADYCSSTDKADNLRKPNTGMLTRSLRNYSSATSITGVDKKEMMMVGDAYMQGDKTLDPDRETAANFGIDYLDVNKFILEYSSDES